MCGIAECIVGLEVTNGLDSENKVEFNYMGRFPIKLKQQLGSQLHTL